jgi:hypothetical protein
MHTSLYICDSRVSPRRGISISNRPISSNPSFAYMETATSVLSRYTGKPSSAAKSRTFRVKRDPAPRPRNAGSVQTNDNSRIYPIRE